ncbi:hypothetical protein Cni_G08392 [Canna indica]|uniref:Mitochondrial import inner membrane translocase subunit TIM50 n=1 Tax=Canna indica TaxID=4628 RepID=A0AAQ3K5T3_9LILI|nr:hypothetical protein Cni_G08392 [Canna indica]
MVKRRSPLSGYGSHSRKSRRRCKLEKDLKIVRYESFEKNSKIPGNSCRYPISDSTDEFTSGNKSCLSAHGTQTTKRADDIARKSGTTHKHGSHFVNLEDTRSKHWKKYKSTRKGTSVTHFTTNYSRISEPVSVLKRHDETSTLNNLPPLAEKQTDRMISSTPDSKTVKMFPRRRRRRRGSKRKLENSQSGNTIEGNVDPNAKNSNMKLSSNELKMKVTDVECDINVDAASNSAETCLGQPRILTGIQAGVKGVNVSLAPMRGLLEQVDSLSFSMRAVSSDVAKNHEECSNAVVCFASERLLSCSKKKLLVLDLNGLLADINRGSRKFLKEHTRVKKNSVLKRPFCDDFLNFCFERFRVGIWSSRKRSNVDSVVDYLMGSLKHELLFSWDKSKCTDTGYKTIENRCKPLVLKELKKLWNKEEHDLPWEKGEYSQLNTLLVDDSPYKAICNPPYTAIFPYPYNYTDKNDNSLGPRGDLRVYLEGLAMADDVQVYVREHPFGQKAIAPGSSSWNFYLKIINQFQNYSSLTT